MSRTFRLTSRPTIRDDKELAAALKKLAAVEERRAQLRREAEYERMRLRRESNEAQADCDRLTQEIITYAQSQVERLRRCSIEVETGAIGVTEQVAVEPLPGITWAAATTKAAQLAEREVLFRQGELNRQVLSVLDAEKLYSIGLQLIRRPEFWVKLKPAVRGKLGGARSTLVTAGGARSRRSSTWRTRSRS